jgi:myosin heavy subunit
MGFTDSFKKEALEALVERIFILDPFDSESASLRSRIETLTPLKSPVFKTVLVPSDECVLLKTTGAVFDDIIASVNESKFELAGESFELLITMEAIDHTFVENRIIRCKKHIADIFIRWGYDMKHACNSDNLLLAEERLHTIRSALRYFDATILDVEAVKELKYHYKTAFLRRERYKEDNRQMEKLKEQLSDKHKQLEDMRQSMDSVIVTLIKDHEERQKFEEEVIRDHEKKLKEAMATHDEDKKIALNNLKSEYERNKQDMERRHEQELQQHRDQKTRIITETNNDIETLTQSIEEIEKHQKRMDEESRLRAKKVMISYL